MNLKNKALASGMALALAVSMMAVPAMAAEPAPAGTNVGSSGGTGNVPVTLTVEAPTFSVTVPTTLPISVSAAGVNTYAQDAKISNLSAGPVKVTNLTIGAKSPWATVIYSDAATMAAKQVNTKEFALNINGAKTTGADAINFAEGVFPRMGGKGAADADMAITYDALLPTQTDDLTSPATIADVVFTVAWDTAA